MRVRVSAVYENRGNILCMKYTYGGKEVYGIPGGGVDRDMAVLQALADEWKNELGVRVEIGDIIFVGEAQSTKRHPQTIHIIFNAKEIYGTPKIRPDNTSSKEVTWLDISQIRDKYLYPDIGSFLYEYFHDSDKRTIPFIQNCMERGYF